jgi:hypothetical protein
MYKVKVHMQSTKHVFLLRGHNIGNVESKKKSNIRLAEIHEIHKNCFLRALTKNLWRPHNCPTPISCQLWIVLPKNVKHPTKKLHTTSEKKPLLTTHDNTNHRFKIICKLIILFQFTNNTMEKRYNTSTHLMKNRITNKLRSIIDSHTPAKQSLSSSDNLL